MFPYGLPSQFSMLITFRHSFKSRRSEWDLVRIEGYYKQPQFGIRLNYKDRSVKVYLPGASGEAAFATFGRVRKVNMAQ